MSGTVIFTKSKVTLAGLLFFFFNDTATTEIYTLSLHDALPIWPWRAARWTACCGAARRTCAPCTSWPRSSRPPRRRRSEEHTSELQSRLHLVCRLLLEKKTSIAIFRPDSYKKQTSVLRLTRAVP